jgi:late competence protein required for DNA uptake (superfamily II DNA/RNA helicase)
VYDLRKLAVNAFPFDLSTNMGGKSHLLRSSRDTFLDNPTLLVSTAATTRGVDLPELSHVFILGVAQNRPLDSYLHMSGRVGRFGRGGKVISILEEGAEGSMKGEETVIQGLFRRLDIKPVQVLV